MYKEKGFIFLASISGHFFFRALVENALEEEDVSLLFFTAVKKDLQIEQYYYKLDKRTHLKTYARSKPLKWVEARNENDVSDGKSKKKK